MRLKVQAKLRTIVAQPPFAGWRAALCRSFSTSSLARVIGSGNSRILAHRELTRDRDVTRGLQCSPLETVYIAVFVL